MQALDEAIAEAFAAGIAVCVAAGDDGASDGVSGGGLHVDFPASSPHALACGGTRLVVSGGTATETAWNDLASNEGATGGGFSAVYSAPAWQTTDLAPYKQTHRGVPDVAADADPETGYDVRVDGSAVVLGGTSAVAPLWSALIARCQQASGKQVVGLSAQLYNDPSACHDITQGNNDGYSAGPGWDPCTGLGTPIGSALLSAVWESNTRSAPGRATTRRRKARRLSRRRRGRRSAS
jgi:kumamolisin